MKFLKPLLAMTLLASLAVDVAETEAQGAPPVVAAVQSTPLDAKRWTQGRIWRWYGGQPWPCGFNYIPAHSISYTEMFMPYNFDAAKIEAELSLAKADGFNCARVVLPFVVWETVADHDAQLWSWNMQSGLNPVKRIGGTQEGYGAVTFSPHGTMLVTGSDADHGNVKVRFWDIHTHQLRHTTQLSWAKSKPKEYFWHYALAVSSDNILAIGGGDGDVRLFNARTASLLRTIKRHTAPITSLAFSPDGKFLVSGSEDKTVKVQRIK